ncbi:dihydrodipicolinate synthase family protein [Virgibacillus xinjiangensis]|uniref:Dihydrodipicolinate synthase family protein n=1 Tax=Virgibacillus xinjiangensis TaxID=393090 RepID=A0ABV7CX35_9BACI
MLTENVHIAVPTAFFEDESLNTQGTISHIKDLYGQGITSVLVSGTTGEQHSLNLQEKMELVDSLEQEEELINHMEIIVGVSSIRQKEAEELAEKIHSTRLSGIMLGYPPYIIPTQKEALTYSKKIIHLSNKPTILYNNPNRTGFDLSAKSIMELSGMDLVVGVKDAGHREKIQEIKDGLDRTDFYFYAGGEEELAEKVSYGYDRLSSIAGNVSPKIVSQWFEKMLKDQQVSEEEYMEVEKVFGQVYHGNAVVNVKNILNRKGHSMGNCRSPIGNG